MDNSYKNINNKYLQAKRFFRDYTTNFLSNSGSGIISKKRMRKINVIGMWMDYIQKYLKSEAKGYLHTTDVTYTNLSDLLDIIAFEFNITYKKIEEEEVSNLLSSSSATTLLNEPTQLNDDSGVLLTESGKSIEIDANGVDETANTNAQQRFQSNPTSPSQSSRGAY